ncbi:AMP-binding protein [Elizabethkingia argentiflava]|uniref:AMP-binding protein n=1 Tax=Elizabethkingia argenteiflava TaxID=2681556 RepID=A0A845PVT4_9FLAO|nr:AMP-binding protein [Elizabethkingia argenteiflava]NAW51934.1 AMP-binding protein [Elizabethkingia argenteiflava]
MLLDFSKNILTDQIIPNNDFQREVLDFLKEWFSDSTTVWVQTSGSTGMPKKFPIEKSKMLNSARMTCDFLDLKEGDTALLCLPIAYISGKMMVVRSLLRKLKLNVVEPSLIPFKNVVGNFTFAAMTPLQVENSLAHLSRIEKLIIGGVAVSELLKRKIFESLLPLSEEIKVQVFETYGMSETLSHIGLKQIFPIAEDYFSLFQGIDISQDPRGCLRIEAPMLHPDVLQTHDMVEILNSKQFRFLGRLDHVINSGGAKIFPEQLEALVKRKIPQEVVFLGVMDQQLGHKLVAVIEGAESISLKDQLLNFKFKYSFHRPKEIIFISEIPRTPNGKVNRIELLQRITKDLS